MPELQVFCQHCGRLMPSGVSLGAPGQEITPAMLAAQQNNHSQCPHCGQLTTWSGGDVVTTPPRTAVAPDAEIDVVAFLFAERVLLDDDQLLSIIRCVDRIEMQPPPGVPAGVTGIIGHLPGVVLCMLRAPAGTVLQFKVLWDVPWSPGPVALETVKIPAGKNGYNLRIATSLPIEFQAGTYYLRLLVNDVFAARYPVELVAKQ